MSKATKKSLLYALAALGLIALAMWLRYASRTVLHSPVYNHLRSGIYIFLLCAWCHSVRVRIVQTQVQRYLLAISMLMVLWLLLRSIKFSIDNTDVERWLWYFTMSRSSLSLCSRYSSPNRWESRRTFICRGGQNCCMCRQCCSCCSF